MTEPTQELRHKDSDERMPVLVLDLVPNLVLDSDRITLSLLSTYIVSHS